MTTEEVTKILSRLYPSERWPKPFNLLQGKDMVDRGEPISAAAAAVGTSSTYLRNFIAAGGSVGSFFGETEPDEAARKAARQILGNLIVGRCAELTFEEIYKEHMHTTELELRDVREGRSDTDYRLFNGKGRPVYRVNIKFHGSLFRRAKEIVDLEPEDCFALATYKIHGALKKQENDQLPYIFVIVGVPNLTAESIGGGVASDLLGFVASVTDAPKIPRKRDIEDRVVSVLQAEQHSAFATTRERIRAANWFVLSARKADRLLRDRLFDRVFALRTRNFSRQFRGAELDMHFSLSQDLTPLATYLDMLRESGYQRVTTLLERGEY